MPSLPATVAETYRYVVGVDTHAPTHSLNRPGSDGGSQSMEDESHVSTQEVRRRVA